jgi:hypothetical protein
MAYERKDMSGSLFKNDRKERGEHPDYNGEVLINGASYWISGWVTARDGTTPLRTKDGKPYMSLSFRVKQPKPAASNIPVTHDDPRTTPRGRIIELDDEVPF